MFYNFIISAGLHKASHIRYFLPTVQIKDNVMINGRNLFYQSVKNAIRTYENIKKIAIG